MNGCVDVVSQIFQVYCKLFSMDLKDIASLGEEIPIPTFTADVVEIVFNQMYKLVKRNINPVVNIKSPCYLIGDLHGNLHDILRFMSGCKEYYTEKFVFLGDYVDRGSYSLETLLFLFVFKLQFPDNVTLLRGNHEFASVNSTYGFSDQMEELFGNDELWNMANEIFSYLPFAAVIDNEILCLHGGLGPSINSMVDIYQIRLPIKCYNESPAINSIVWSDPCPETAEYIQSIRGEGFLFGSLVLLNFFRNTNLKCLIRSHQCVKNGVENPYGHHNHNLITVFSSSNYGGMKNCAAFLHYDNGHFDTMKLSPIEVRNRCDAYKEQIVIKEKIEPLYMRGLNVIHLLNSRNNCFRRSGPNSARHACNTCPKPPNKCTPQNSMGAILKLPQIGMIKAFA